MKYFRKLLKKDEGAVAVELVPVAAFLLFMFVSLFNLFDYIVAWIKATKANYAITDMLTRQTDLNNGFLTALDGVFDSISQTRRPKETWFEVMVVRKDSAGNLQIVWQHDTFEGEADNTPLKTSDIASAIPDETPTNDYLIYVQTHSRFTPLFGPDSALIKQFFGENYTISQEIIAPSRFTANLTNADYSGGIIINPDSNDGTDLDDTGTGDPDADSAPDP